MRRFFQNPPGIEIGAGVPPPRLNFLAGGNSENFADDDLVVAELVDRPDPANAHLVTAGDFAERISAADDVLLAGPGQPQLITQLRDAGAGRFSTAPPIVTSLPSAPVDQKLAAEL